MSQDVDIGTPYSIPTDREVQKPRIFVASPLFNPAQLKTIYDVIRVCHAEGYATFNAHRDGILLPANRVPPEDRPSTIEERDEAILTDKAAIWACDAMVCILDESDTGTSWEFGGANMTNKPVVTVSPRTGRRNVMLAQTCVAHTNDLNELATVLRELRPHLVFGRKVDNNAIYAWNKFLEKMRMQYFFRGDVE